MLRSKPVLIVFVLLIAVLVALGGYVTLGKRVPTKPVITETPVAAQLRAERCKAIEVSLAEAQSLGLPTLSA